MRKKSSSKEQLSGNLSPDNPPIQLARHLGLFEATMIGVGAMIGAGIFVLTGIATGNAGPAALIAFALNGIVTLFTALSYAELASAIPEAGGGYSFIKKVMPNSIAFTSGWMLWFAYIVACSLYAKGFGSYFFEFMERYLPSVGHFILKHLGRTPSVAILTVIVSMLFITINIIGTHASGKTENIITMSKIVILSVFIGFGIKQVLSAPTMVISNFTPLFPMGFHGVLAAMGLTFIAFEGYDLIATVSEEVKEPRKTIPRAIMLSLIITMIIYMLVVFVSLGAVSPAEGLPTWRLLGKYGEVGIIRAAQSFMPQFGVILVLGGGLFATLSALNATVLASSRVAFSMGRDWMLPNSLSRIHSIKKTPVLSISVSGIMFILIAIFLPLETIGIASSLLFLLTFSLVNIALIIYRKRSLVKPSFRSPLFPLTPLLGIITSLGLGMFQMLNKRTAFALAGGWIIIGLLIYVTAFSKRVSIADVPKVIESPELLGLKKTRCYKVLIPLANPGRIKPLIQLGGKIAEGCHGEILAMNVIALPNITSYTEADPFLHETHNIIRTAQSLAIAQNIPFSFLTKIGRSSAAEIVQVAQENHCQLILLGYKKDEDPLENSVIHHVVSRQPCDVLIFKSDKEYLPEFKCILLPIGGREIHDPLKARIVHCLQKNTQCQITLLKVIPPGGGKAVRRRSEEGLKRSAKVYNLSNANLVVHESVHAAGAIVERSEDHDLLILGMREEPWFRSFFFGTIAQQITGQVKCPVLLVKAKSIPRSRMKKVLKISRDPTCPVNMDTS
jgi:amino acid transporter/nucleotide-binding universal stress UspA family protein